MMRQQCEMRIQFQTPKRLYPEVSGPDGDPAFAWHPPYARVDSFKILFTGASIFRNGLPYRVYVMSFWLESFPRCSSFTLTSYNQNKYCQRLQHTYRHFPRLFPPLILLSYSQPFFFFERKLPWFHFQKGLKAQYQLF